MFATNFTAIDWLIVAVYLVGTGWLGIAVNRYIHSADDYLVGGRTAGTALSIATFIGTGLGLVTLMYAAQDGYTRGFCYLFVPVLGMIVPFVLGATGFVMARLRQMRLVTIPEFFERRFSPRVRVLAGVICVLAGVLNMGLFPKMGAIFITYAAGLGSATGDSDVTVNLVTSLLIIVVLAYTVSGGMVAVIVTDYVQFVVLSLGLAIGLGYCFFSPMLGWERMVETLWQARGEAAFNPVHPDSYGWTYVVWMTFVAATAGICWAPEATRALTTVDVTTTNRTFLFGSPGFFARMAVPAVLGIAAFCFVQQQPELADYFGRAAVEGDGGRTAQAMPLFLGKMLPTGILGLFVAGAMAALMSTHDSYLLAWSSVIAQDVVGPMQHERRLSDKQSILFTRIGVVGIGIFLLVWGIWYKLPDSVWTYMGVTGTVYLSGSATALVGGMYWSRASATGAAWALLGGLFALPTLFLEPIQQLAAEISGRPVEGVTTWLNNQTIGLGTYAMCLMLFIAGSLFFPDRRSGDGATVAGAEP
jgi:SSS family solute:Na+ symporter